MKKSGIIGIAFVAGVIVGVLSTPFWQDLQIKEAGIMEPEGYSEPEEMIAKTKGLRIEELDISESVQKYHESIELVAFAPGSGWLRFKTRDGITPTLSFFDVTDEAIDQFNKFSKSIGEPIRVAVSGKVLKITAEETAADLERFADAGEVDEKYKLKGFYRPEPLPTLALRKDANGNIFLVKPKDKDDVGKSAIALKK